MIKGLTVSPGIVIGKAQILEQYNFTLPIHKISDPEAELASFYNALDLVVKDLDSLMCSCEDNINDEYLDILDAQIVMVKDPSILKYVEEQVRIHFENASKAFHDKCDYYIRKFRELDNEYIKERISDIIDMRNRVLGYLLHKKPEPFIPKKDSIVIALDISPSFIISKNCTLISGYITEAGSPISHASIVAKSLELPSLIHVEDATNICKEDDIIILNAREGYFIVNPTKEELDDHKKLIDLDLKKKHKLSQIGSTSYTKDKYKLNIHCNMSSVVEIPSVIKNKAEGVGLFRTELLFMESSVFPDRDMQYANYAQVLDLPYKSITLRTLDVGGDKSLPYAITNLRGIQYSLQNINRFKIQIKAMLTANKKGNLRIMIPLVKTLDEIIRSKDIIKQCALDCNVSTDSFKFGVMIETMEILDVIDDVFQLVDFVSIGTNDLQSSFYGVNRFNLLKSYELQPPFLNILKRIIDAALKNKVSCSVCGEMASNIDGALILIGFGVKTLSMSSNNVLHIREQIQNYTFNDIQSFSSKLITLKSEYEVLELLNQLKNSIK